MSAAETCGRCDGAHVYTSADRRPCATHGVSRCTICVHPAGTCDYGTCCQPAVWSVRVVGLEGRTLEVRPACARHAEWMASGMASPRWRVERARFAEVVTVEVAR